MAPRPVVVVSVGTDHHRFDRLIDWLEIWDGASAADVRVQHGSSRPMRGGENRPFLPPDELAGWMRQASAVVLQGGPGGIVDALRAGVRPIAVPRLARLGEAVDDHQVAFVRRMSERGLVTVVTSAAQLSAALGSLEPRSGPIVDLTVDLVASGPATVRARLGAPPEPLSAAHRRRRLANLLRHRNVSAEPARAR